MDSSAQIMMRNSKGQFLPIEKGLEWIESQSMPVTETGCWLWAGYVAPDGYGRYRSRRDGRNWTAHRLVFNIVNGYLPKVVMHKCDVRSCVNPSHLEGGTQKKNLQDMVDRGRGGSGMFKQQISDKVREEIFKAGGTQASIAKKYGVGPSLVSRIKSNTDTNRKRFGG